MILDTKFDLAQLHVLPINANTAMYLEWAGLKMPYITNFIFHQIWGKICIQVPKGCDHGSSFWIMNLQWSRNANDLLFNYPSVNWISDDLYSASLSLSSFNCSEFYWLQIPGLVNVDFADVRAIMKDAGSSLMGIGTATGELEIPNLLMFWGY